MNEITRLCIGCNKLHSVDNLIKVKLNKGRLIVNPRTYFPGRSSYLCYNMECIDKIKKYRKLEKSFKNKIKITEHTWNLIERNSTRKRASLSMVLGKFEGK